MSRGPAAAPPVRTRGFPLPRAPGTADSTNPRVTPVCVGCELSDDLFMECRSLPTPVPVSPVEDQSAGTRVGCMSGTQRTYLLVDGENIDATLGNLLGHRPTPEERPRWDRLLAFLEQGWDQPVTGLFFLAANGELPHAFVQALLALGFRPIALSGTAQEKVVDIAIQRTLEALVDRRDDVVLASHDGDFLPQLEQICDGRRVAVVGFPEFRHRGFLALADRGLESLDLEHDVKAFNVRLPRVRIIPIDEFDPLEFL